MAAAKFQRFVVNSAVVGGVMFCGWVMMKALTPTKEQMMEVSFPILSNFVWKKHELSFTY